MEHSVITESRRPRNSRVGGIARLAPDDPIHVSFDPAGMVFFDRETGRRIEVGGPEHG
jgi:hypothetical protein